MESKTPNLLGLIREAVTRLLDDTTEVSETKLNFARIQKSIEKDENAGFCKSCGTKHMQVEPDARKYTCKKCKKPDVYGAEELLFHI